MRCLFQYVYLGLSIIYLQIPRENLLKMTGFIVDHFCWLFILFNFNYFFAVHGCPGICMPSGECVGRLIDSLSAYAYDPGCPAGKVCCNKQLEIWDPKLDGWIYRWNLLNAAQKKTAEK